MTTHSAVTALLRRPTIPSVLKRTLPSASESRLLRIADGKVSATNAYRNEDRPWMDLVDDDQVYAILACKAYQDFIRIAEICA